MAGSEDLEDYRLLPCPFCGREVTAFAKRGDAETIHVLCRCGATGPAAKDKDQACQFWNSWAERWN